MIHLKAIAGRIGVDLALDDWTNVGRGTPTLVDLMPSGRFLMEDFYYAGGLPAVLRRLGEAGRIPHPDALTANGKTLWENVKDAPAHNDDVIRVVWSNPLVPDGSMRILHGNLAPRGAVVKPSAATAKLLKHRGRAVVFENLDDYKARIADPALDVTADSVLVLKNCGPRGYPGMAEVGNMGLPPKLLEQGVTDMVRISDARMSGTAYGTVVLHVAPEARAGGPLAVVREGDWIELDADAGRLHLDVTDKELAERLAAWAAALQPDAEDGSGYRQAAMSSTCCRRTRACDFDFLVGPPGRRRAQAFPLTQTPPQGDKKDETHDKTDLRWPLVLGAAMLGLAPGAMAQGKLGLVGIAMPTKSSARWIADGDNMVKVLQERGYKTDLQYADNDIPNQLAQIENMITKGDKVLVIAAIDGTTLSNALQKAADKGVKVIAYDRLIRGSKNVDYYATFDNFQVGVLQGGYIVDKLGLKQGKGPFNIELFGGSPDDNNAFFFYDGAMSVLKPYIDSGKLVVRSKQMGMEKVGTLRWDGAVAQARMDNLLSAFYTKEKVHAVLSPYDGLSIGILSSLKGVGYCTAQQPCPVVSGQDAEVPSVKSISARRAVQHRVQGHA